MTTDYEPIGVRFSLRCLCCDDGDGVCCREQAIAAGWRNIEYDDGLSWNFLGVCPACAPGFLDDAQTS